MNDTPRFRIGWVLPWAVIGVIFGIEFGGGLSLWRVSNMGDSFSVSIYSLTLLVMVWVFLVVLAEMFSHLLRSRFIFEKRGLLFTLRIFGSTVVSAVWVFVLLNLAVRHALGCFLNPSLIHFAFANISQGLWAHTATKYRWMLFAAVLFLGISTPIVFARSWRDIYGLRLFGNPSLRSLLLVVALLATCGFTYSTLSINREENKQIKTAIVRHLCYQVEPVLSFSLGCMDLYRELHDERAVLDQSKLISRSTAFSLPAPLAARPNIIFFQIESCRPDVIDMIQQGMEVTPNLNRLARSGTRFTKAYAPGTHTSLSNVSIPSSLCALRSPMLAVYRAADPQPRTFIYDVLKPLGYRTGWISSDFEGWAGMRDYLETSNLDVFMDSTTLKVEAHPELMNSSFIHVTLEPDTNTFAHAIKWIGQELERKEPFYLTLSMSDSHFPYDSSLHTNWFQPCGIPPGATIFDYRKSDKEQVRNTYLNSIRGIDVLLGQLISFLHEHGADEHTIIVVYGDHGESFYENNILSHANLPYDPSARTTLVMYGKGYFAPEVENYPTSLIDVVPTVLARLGVPHHPNFQGTDVLSPSRPAAMARSLYIHVDGRVNGDGLVAGGRWKYFTDNGTGASFLYDLDSDPGESTNLIDSQASLADLLGQQLQVFCTGQLAYYRLPRYYAHYYPPAPPQFELSDKAAAR
jgi:arylsulfatase A-like enzyme